MKRWLLLLLLIASPSWGDFIGTGGSGSGGTPGGSAGGDLSGTYPNPTVAKVNGNTPGGTCDNQFTRSINTSAIPTCASVATTDAASLSGNGTKFVSGTGTYTSGNGLVIDASGNVVDSGAPPATGDITSGTTTITSGTDTSPCFDDAGVINCSDAGWSFNKTSNALTATTFVGALTGNASTSTAFAANPTNCLAGNYPLGVDTSGNAENCTAAATGTVTGTGTAGLNATWTSASALGDATNFPISVPNDSGTGTTVNKLAKFTSTGTAVITGAAETAGILGVVKDGAGTTGSAKIVTLGATSCVSDNATTAGHFAGVSASTAGSCTNLGATFPASGTQVIGTWTETGIAGTRTLFFGTPDVASAASGGGGGGSKNPAGAAGDVQYRASGNNFAAEAAFNYNAADNRLALSSMTTATDNATQMFSIAGTLPTVPTATVFGTNFNVTSAGSASFGQYSQRTALLAGYTGSSITVAAAGLNAVAGTGATLHLGNNTEPVVNTGAEYLANASTTGINVGSFAFPSGSTNANIGFYGKAGHAVAGTNIGVLANAASSTEATDLKNVGVYATLHSTLVTASNISAAIIGQTTGSDDIFRGYDETTLMFRMEDTGEFTSAGVTSIGWTPVAAANQACNTTCTNACVFGTDSVTGGILACTDATADSCLCAGGS